VALLASSSAFARKASHHHSNAPPLSISQPIAGYNAIPRTSSSIERLVVFSGGVDTPGSDFSRPSGPGGVWGFAHFRQEIAEHRIATKADLIPRFEPAQEPVDLLNI
jgi:hypothetical protein